MTRAPLLVVAVLIAGCSVAPRAGVSASAPIPSSAPVGTTRIQSADRMLVRRGELSETVEDLTPPLVRTHALTASLGGYVASESRDSKTVSVSLRVPEPKLDVALDSLSMLGDVKARSVSSQDVTEETIDVQARIASLTAERDQLRALLSKATAMSDIFTIERELARVQGDIDSFQHRLEHLRSTAALAQLDAEFKKRREAGPLTRFFSAIGRGIGKLF
jgi:hypothetical protein